MITKIPALTSKQLAGDLARAREFIKHIDAVLTVTGDTKHFTSVDPQAVEVIVNPLMSARRAVCNLLLDLGEGYNGYNTAQHPPEQPLRSRT